MNKSVKSKLNQCNLSNGDYFSEEKEASEFLLPPVERGKVSLFFILIILGSLLFLGRIFYLEVIKGDYYRKMAEGNQLRIEKIKASRGLIYDVNGRLLVRNVPEFSLINMPGEKTIEKRIPYELALKTIVRSSEKVSAIGGSTSGGKVKIEPQRKYLNGSTFSHLLGFVGKISKEEFKEGQNYDFNDSLGKDGLEFYYENVLRGEDGRKKIEVNSLGQEEKILNEEASKDGKDIILSIDAELQKKVKEILEKYIGPKGAGVVIMMNPLNGQILSMVSLPTYDNNLLKDEEVWQQLNKNPQAPLFNRAIAGLYPSGSIIKPVIALAALEEGLINERTTVLSTGGIRYGKWFFPDWKKGGHGRVNVIDALSWSVNTFFYYLGGGYGDFKGLGLEKIDRYLSLVGLGEKTGIDLPFEKQGFLPTEDWKKKTKGEEWYIGDTYHLSIGQGDLLVTPLQVTNYMSMIANGGTIFKPSIVKQVTPQIIREIKKAEPRSAPTHVGATTEENIEIVKKGLRKAVVSGSARGLSSLKVKAAGKTGTAQVGGNLKPHAWFSGFAPFDNPEVVITVLIENSGEGSDKAVKVAREILNYYFKHNYDANLRI